MKSLTPILIGVIADDFTGGSDAASFLTQSGLRTILYKGLPKELPKNCDAVVIALKTRSINPEKAVKESIKALKWLKSIHANQVYFKYCSTFDSRKKGNIGPVLDSLMDFTGLSYTVLCPSLPINGRTVKDGILFVNGIPLSDSHMKNHPLNPMWSSYIPELMRDQSKYPCFVLSRKQMKEKSKVANIIETYKKENERFYLIPDYECDQDGRNIAEIFGNLYVLSGGSGLLKHLYENKRNVNVEYSATETTENKSIILCGSCSRATASQIKYFKEKGGVSYPVDSKKLLNNTLTVNDIWSFVANNKSKTTLIYSDMVDKKENILDKGESFAKESELIENIMADLSKLAEKNGFNRIVVAGGETSGAVMLKLGYDAYYIGRSIDPGVPEIIPVKNTSLRIVLKSGNFGSEDFFEKAVKEK